MFRTTCDHKPIQDGGGKNMSADTLKVYTHIMITNLLQAARIQLCLINDLYCNLSGIN